MPVFSLTNEQRKELNRWIDLSNLDRKKLIVKDKEALIYSSDMRKADTHTTRELTYGKELPNGHPNKGSSGRSLGSTTCVFGPFPWR